MKLHLLSKEQIEQNFKDIAIMTGDWEKEERENDEFLSKYCDNCHIPTKLCECLDCEICEEARL